ncbi:hypothetical protein, partial [Halodesulfovibrio spirochaetisodalis]|uniref:hypothetical protein n=1 Tax=Halodesulfovibrio spirochaetisodalis TaxID=1560234 RepID=UPI000B2ECA6C
QSMQGAYIWKTMKGVETPFYSLPQGYAVQPSGRISDTGTAHTVPTNPTQSGYKSTLHAFAASLSCLPLRQRCKASHHVVPGCPMLKAGGLKYTILRNQKNCSSQRTISHSSQQYTRTEKNSPSNQACFYAKIKTKNQHVRQVKTHLKNKKQQ